MADSTQPDTPLSYPTQPPTPGDRDTPREPSDRAPLPRSIPNCDLLGEIGRGAMGVVYRAVQTTLNREVAVKVILLGEFQGNEIRERFAAEGQALASLDHPGIVRIHDFGTTAEGVAYFVMEFCPGGDFAKSLSEQRPTARRSAELVALMADAVQSAHDKGVIHRDLKPGNVLLAADGTPKIADFGLALRKGAVRLTAAGQPLGTPPYVAPEQVRGLAEVGPANDVYSLGAILFECLIGEPPFQGKNLFDTMCRVVNEPPPGLRSLDAQVPAELEMVCLKCLEKDPKDRYASAKCLADDLRRFLAGERPEVVPAPPAEPKPPALPPGPTPAPLLELLPDRRPTRRRALVACGLALGVLLVGLGYGLIRTAPRVGPKSPPYGVVAIGGKSVTGLAVEVFDSADGLDFKPLRFNGRDEIAFDGLGLATAVGPDGSIPEEELAALRAKVREFVEAIARQGVPYSRISVVCSSGALFAVERDAPAAARARAALTRAVRDVGHELQFVGQSDEGRLAHVCCVPRASRGSTMLIDVGGGNTTGGSFDEQGQFSALAFGMGSALFAAEVKQAGGTPEAAKGLREGKMAAAIREVASDSPAARNRKKVYLIGDAAWGLTRFARPEADGLRTELIAGDFDRYHALLYSNDDVQEIKREALRRVKEPKARARAEGEIDRITGRLPLGYLRAGAEILMALKQELKLEGRELITFDKGNIAWPLGYLLEKAQQQR